MDITELKHHYKIFRSDPVLPGVTRDSVLRIACYRSENVVVNGGAGEISQRLFSEITGIQYGEIGGRYGWVRRVE